PDPRAGQHRLSRHEREFEKGPGDARDLFGRERQEGSRPGQGHRGVICRPQRAAPGAACDTTMISPDAGWYPVSAGPIKMRRLTPMAAIRHRSWEFWRRACLPEKQRSKNIGGGEAIRKRILSTRGRKPAQLRE